MITVIIVFLILVEAILSCVSGGKPCKPGLSNEMTTSQDCCY